MPEFWDAYDRIFSRIKDITLVRGEPFPEGVYHPVCDIIVKHTDGSYLLMKRDSRKHHDGTWELAAGGSALQEEEPFDKMNYAQKAYIYDAQNAANRSTHLHQAIRSLLAGEEISQERLKTLLQDYGWNQKDDYLCIRIGLFQREIRRVALTYNCIQIERILHVHLNTLKYRVNRIRELTGMDLKNQEEVFYVWLSFGITGKDAFY